MNKKLLGLLICTCLATGTARADKTDFTKLYTFGDSFTYGWTNSIEKNYGIGLIQSGIGGVQNYISNVGGKVGNSAIHILYHGANDISDIITQVSVDLLVADVNLDADVRVQNSINVTKSLDAVTFPTAVQAFDAATDLIASNVKALHDAGAQYIVVPYHFNDAIRQVGGDGFSMLGQFVSDQYNKTIYKKIKDTAPNANVIFLATDKLIEEVTSNPSKYFAGPAYVAAGIPSDARLFDATSHFTPEANQIFYQYVTSVIESAGRVSMVRESRIAHGQQLVNEDRLWAIDPEPTNAAGSIGYVHSSAKKLKQSKLGATSNGVSAKAAADYALSDSAALGLRIIYSKDEGDFSGKHGKYNSSTTMGILRGTHSFGADDAIFVYGNIGAGMTDYDVKRKVLLGKAVHAHSGKTKGSQYLATIGAGMKFNLTESIHLAPYVDVTHQRVDLKGFKERQDNSTSMHFVKFPSISKTSASIGASMNSSKSIFDSFDLKPKLSLGYNHSLNKVTEKNAVARVKALPVGANFKVPTYNLSRHAGNFGLGLSSDVTSLISLGVTTSANFGAKLYDFGGAFSFNMKL